MSEFDAFVLASAVVGGLALTFVAKLRLHGFAVVACAAVWFGGQLIGPTIIASAGSSGSRTAGIGISVVTEMGAIIFAVYHCLICFALVLTAKRLCVRWLIS